ncbi:unnamed protein product [Amaranthus hypochondriacus]
MNFSVHYIPFFMIIIITLIIQLHKSVEAGEYDECKKPFLCGKTNMSYPFYNEEKGRPMYCGHPGFEVSCEDDRSWPEISVMTSSSEKFYLVNMDLTSDIISVSPEVLLSKDLCPNPQDLYDTFDTTLNLSTYSYIPTTENVTLYYECSFPSSQFSSGSPYKTHSGLPYTFLMSLHSVDGIIDHHHHHHHHTLYTSFKRGNYGPLISSNITDKEALCDACRKLNGVCGYDATSFTCNCPDDHHGPTCYVKPLDNGIEHGLTKSKIIAVILVSVFGLGVCLLSVLILSFKRMNSIKKSKDVEALLKKHGSLGPKRYSYTDLKRITNSFKIKLGEGGYGVVYKGKLNNGHLVAVKILKKSSKEQLDVVEFINEVASIGNTNHKNIVKLLGFCYEGQKRAFVYDYMPCGSLEKYTYGSRQKSNQLLSWESLFEIAVGIARGLEYLHRGCNMRILHFDIKPQNILLDENYCPKISDFGLAKICPQKDSIISISEARGTVGYIAPELLFKSFGGVSHKSDVYSYGMLVLEIVGCRNNANANAECSSVQYFPQWIYKELEEVEELNQLEITNGDEGSILRRKMVVVSLWCIQPNPLSRPSMTKVVEMLEGALESLQIPPMPTLAPPMALQQSPAMDTISIGGLFQE